MECTPDGSRQQTGKTPGKPSVFSASSPDFVEKTDELCYTTAYQNDKEKHMNELEQEIREHVKKNPFLAHNFMELEHVERDYAVFRLEIREESRNPYGMVHGGALYTLADNATGAAAHTDGRAYVTQGSHLQLLRNQHEGVIRAKARLRHRGRSTCLVDVDIVNEQDVLLATGSFTFFCVDPSILAQKVEREKHHA